MHGQPVVAVHLDAQCDTAQPRVLVGLAHDVLGDLAQAHRHPRLPAGPVADPRQLEQVVDEPRHAVHGHADLGQRRRHVVDDPVLDALGQRPQAGQRRAQVVRHEGHELAAAGLEPTLAAT